MSKLLKVDFNGMEALESELNKRFSGEALTKVIDKALVAGGNVIKKELTKNFESFKDTGASRDEITVSKPMTLNGIRTVVIYWYGERQRWHIIHMNEFGTVKNPNPRGKGAIERSMRAAQDEFYNVVAQEIGRSMI